MFRVVTVSKVGTAHRDRQHMKCDRSVQCTEAGIELVHNIYSNNRTTIKIQSLLIYDTPHTCFGLQWPSSGRWLAKESVIMVNYITDVQILNLNYMF